ncbi:glycosyltransferase family 39 protein [Amnibacterium kyonggiense]|uniref:Dolichyl-phosphate-mannose-protein mannosyltransferase n=1 Tax=Amnibacterium kyonggiense TaxID=595671 RepID=A0A4R7FLQ9_9MICO|nr:glycosyltransferase family 39 protein [Amnibacterium kyonggiense]TDS77355.1 dolichyl-phosphate-mannose-protein mannosyltransferase [Amnibacterium kyonggiense]
MPSTAVLLEPAAAHLRREPAALRARLDLRAVLPPALALLVVLTATAGGYGYHRDELYFRMLPPAWGYIDQPPFTPLVARVVAGVVDEAWALRLVAALVAAVAVLVVAAITAEVGGGRGAQALAAWGAGFGYYPLLLGHVLFTATFDLVVWPLVLLLVIRAVLRRQGAWFLLAGLVAGASLYNKLLVLALLLAIAIGLAAAGPRRAAVWGWAAAGALIVLVVGAPNLVWQATHGLPQLRIGAALSAQNAAAVRPFVVPFLVALLGPTLVPVCVAGFLAPFRRGRWRDLRWLPVALVAIVALVVLMGAQLYYDLGVLTAVFAVGCVPAVEWARTRGRRAMLVAAVAVNAAAAALLALPVVPASALAGTVVPAWNQAARDQLGWPALAHRVDAVDAAHGTDAVVLTRNYGEAGAIERYAPSLAGRTFSGHNAMHDAAPPPATTDVVVAVGYSMGWLRQDFAQCETVTRLPDADRVVSQETGAPVRVCTGRLTPITRIWERAAWVG